jgi:hypothetical protein
METETYKGYTIEIRQDDTGADSPRDWDNIGTMSAWHPRYDLGDKEHGGISKDEAIELPNRDDVICLPICILDHSGVWMRTGKRGFQEDPGGWDTSHVGYIWVTKEKMKKEFSKKKWGKKLEAKAYEILEQEVKTYSQYLEGDIWGFIITDASGNDVDSCYGFYGYDYCLQEAKSQVDYYAKEAEKENAEYMMLQMGYVPA